jgi:hypothetical protein
METYCPPSLSPVIKSGKKKKNPKKIIKIEKKQRKKTLIRVNTPVGGESGGQKF